MKILVDYDNIPKVITIQGLAYVADRVLAAVAPHAGQSLDVLELRLYGGWDENSTLTRRAQDLEAEIRRSFPKMRQLRDSTPPKNVLVICALARSLEALPKKVLPNTLRQVVMDRKMACANPTGNGCKYTGRCAIASVVTFIQGEKCPAEDCYVQPAKLLTTVEQKLVDTMIVTDLVYLSNKESHLGLVSSDDDLWPGIMLAMTAGAHVIQI